MKKRLHLTDWQAAYGVNAKAKYADYRHGSSKPVSVAPVFRKRERDQIVDVAMDVMRDWNLTPFENEGDVRAGIRSALCLRGNMWQSSDLEAEMIVGNCLHRLGAERPAWEAGQPEYTIPAENCSRCGGPKDPATRGRFCCVECARAFMLERQASDSRRADAVYRSATRVLRQDRRLRRNCVNCNTSFMHDGEKDPRQFCSQGCYHRFQATEAAARFDRICKFCERPFRTKVSNAMFCCDACQITESRIRTGRNVPKRLTRPIYDFVFTRPINAAIAKRRQSAVPVPAQGAPALTSAIFDRLFEEAA